MKKQMCSVYAAPKPEGLYVYLPKAKSLQTLPKALLERLGQARWVVDILITQEKVLSRVSGAKVLADIEEKGFYLQLPPGEKENFLASHLEQLARSSGADQAGDD